VIAGRFHISPDDIPKHADAERAYWDHIAANDVPETFEYKEVRAKNGDLKKRAEELIAEFYSQRPAGSEPALSMHNVGPSGLFKIEGAHGFIPDVPAGDVERYKENLLNEQADMMALTEFLKKKFFQGGSI